MINRHERTIQAPLDVVRRWIPSCWSGTPDDAFPRDVIATWRKNPPGIGAGALVPGKTELGHGPFRFRFESWDGARFRVAMAAGGWHGFDLEETADGCKVTHTIEAPLKRLSRVRWAAVVAPVHDWAVEALLDRLEEAAKSGSMPSATTRPMSTRAALTFRALRALAKKSNVG